MKFCHISRKAGLLRPTALAVALFFGVAATGCSTLKGLGFSSADEATQRTDTADNRASTPSLLGWLTDSVTKADAKPSKNETSAEISAAVASGLSRSQVLMRSGMASLRDGEYEDAQKIFNTALKFDFKSAELHFLNGLTYHLRYLRGDAENLPLAEAGYQAALLNDPSMDIAKLQLGRLLFDAKDYARSKQVFAEAAAVNLQSIDALYGLANAAAFDGDMVTSYWSAQKLEELKWDSPLLYRLKAMHAALAKQPERARAYAATYAERTDDANDARYLRDRIQQLAMQKVSFQENSSGDNRAIDTRMLYAQASPEGAPAAPPGGSAAPAAAGAAAGDAASAGAATGSARQRWFRCDKEPGIPLQPNVAPPPAPTEEAFTTPVLPSPCPGESPEMVFIEVTMIRTEESQNNSLGINLLDGLQSLTTLTKDRSVANSGAVEVSRKSNFVLANAAGAGDKLRYSLNIANAAYTKNEVIARPTLAAIDRVPAVFFSGATITIGVSGANGGASTVVDKPVGVSLSVTPTFIDDDNILVSLRASRSYINSGAGTGSTQILLSQTRNSINASSILKFGETFIVSGLVERDINDVSSGVPVLQDIPVLQYFFKKSEKIDFNRQIITLITIRRVVNNEIEAQRAKTGVGGAVSLHALSKTVDELIGLQNANTVVDEVLRGFRSDNMLYNRLRSKDFIQESINEKGKASKFLNQIKDMLYF